MTTSSSLGQKRYFGIVCRRLPHGLFQILIRNKTSLTGNSTLGFEFTVALFHGVGESLKEHLESSILLGKHLSHFYYEREFSTLSNETELKDGSKFELCIVECDNFTPPDMVWLSIPQLLKLEGLTSSRKLLLKLLQYLARTHEDRLKALEQVDLGESLLDR